MKRIKGTFLPAILNNGARVSINTATLPKKDWKTHSGEAPVAKETVNSMQSQDIAGTKTVAVRLSSGKEFTEGAAELERFCADRLTGLGYTVNPPAGS